MITLIEALNFRCLRYVRQPLQPFNVLVGPNASGKTTFLDVVSFLGRLVSGGLEAAIVERSSDFRDLVWNRHDLPVELAIEAMIPDRLRSALSNGRFDRIRYEIRIGPDSAHSETIIQAETVLLKKGDNSRARERMLFPESQCPPETILLGSKGQSTRTVVNKVSGGNDNFYSEVQEKGGKGWVPAFKLGPKRSALANLPEDESRFPAATWLKGLLTSGVRKVVLNSMLMRQASPPALKGASFRTDGSNLPWTVEHLSSTDSDSFSDWIEHVRTALPDIRSIKTVERPDDRHRYLILTYDGDLDVPSWGASDGTLRLLALTLPAYLRSFEGVYLIEEPENGIHPQAVDCVIQSLSSVYDAQILAATHSPVVLGTVEPNRILCFAKTKEGATDIVVGSDHPRLKNWRGEENLSVIFAAGILG